MPTDDIRELEERTCKALGIGPRYLITSEGSPYWWSGPPAWGTDREAVLVENPDVATDPVAFELVAQALGKLGYTTCFWTGPEGPAAKLISPEGFWLEAAGDDWKETICKAVCGVRLHGPPIKPRP